MKRIWPLEPAKNSGFAKSGPSGAGNQSGGLLRLRPWYHSYPLMDHVESSSPGAITLCLQAWHEGEADALQRLTAEVYAQLRRLAAAVAWKSGRQTIDPTELVHELYFRLPGVREIDWRSRGQFLSVAAAMMRRILVDHARRRAAAKRNGEPVALPIGREPSAAHLDILLVHQSLQRFAQLYPRQAQVVELRFFGGLTAEETADALQSQGETASTRTVERDWTFARAWLQDAIRA